MLQHRLPPNLLIRFSQKKDGNMGFRFGKRIAKANRIKLFKALKIIKILRDCNKIFG